MILQQKFAMAADTYDIVIVGGGTAGLVIAARLSDDPGLQVAVIESGVDDSSNPNVQTPCLYHSLRKGPLDWDFNSTSESPHGGRPVSLAAGRTLGGTSAINGFVFQPSSKSNLDFWTELGNSGWGFEALDRAVRKAVTVHGPSGTTPRGSGPIQLVVNESEVEASWVKTWNESLAQLGQSPCDAFSGSQRGPITNLDTVDPVSGKRSFTTNAYLDPIRSRRNLTILTGSTVNKVVFKEGCSGVEPVADGVQVTSRDGKKNIIKTRKEVILAAGVFNSPRILELSGIGGRSRLQNLGIDCIVDNPHVGENFQNHCFSGLVFPVRDDVETLDAFIRKEPSAVSTAEKTYASGKGGPIGRSSTLMSAQMPMTDITDEYGMDDIRQLLKEATGKSSGPSAATPEFQRAWDSYIGRSLTSDTESPGRFMFIPCFSPFDVADPSYRAPGNHFTIVNMVSTPLPRGSVHINSSSLEHSDRNTGMTLDVSLSPSPLDVEVLARYVMYTEKTLAKLQPFASLLKPRNDRFANIEEAREYVKANTAWTHHFVGTCAMMSQEMGGVVDDKLRVYGCANLRVCDASIIPVVPRSNPQAVVYGVAEHGSDIIKETLL
ncbi:alcohol oxidase [Xylariaceae sp. FL0594]|nr:alcohol oxidase [Xylariaceae sp. FL0594]